MSTTTVRDPMITIGRYRVFQRTDGKAFVYDPDAPFLHRTVCNRTFTTLDEAKAFATKIVGAQR